MSGPTFQRGMSRPQRAAWPRVSSGPGPRQSCRLSLCCRGSDRGRHFVINQPETGATSSQGTPRATAPWRNSCTITRRCSLSPSGRPCLLPAPSGRYPSSLGGGVGDGAEYPGQGCPPLDHMPFLAFYFLPPMGTQCRVLGEGDSVLAEVWDLVGVFLAWASSLWQEARGQPRVYDHTLAVSPPPPDGGQ